MTSGNSHEARRALHEMDRAGLALFPLRRGSKIPRDRGWQENRYSVRELRAWLEKGGNIGVRPGPGDLVIDVDPRHARAGDDPVLRLSLDTGFDLESCPTVWSGRGDGGRHLYLTKPPDVAVVGKLPEYPGLEFKSAGVLLVAPGSLHPDTGKPYRLDGNPSERPEAPTALLELIERAMPEIRAGAGVLSNEQLAALLAVLDPEQYRDQNSWFKLMCSAHDATAGGGLVQWLEWCARDNAYNDEDHQSRIAVRWNSLTAGKKGGATYRTLLRAVADAGRPDLVAALNDGVDDFEDHEAEVIDPIDRTAPVIDLIDLNAEIKDFP